MLKLDLILQIMNKNAIPLIDHYQKEDSEEEPEKEPTKAITKRKKISIWTAWKIYKWN